MTGGHKPQQLPEPVPHLKERTYVCGFPTKRGGRLTPCLKWHGRGYLKWST